MRSGRWLLLVAAMGGACGHGDPCRNRLLASVPSPDGRVKAVVFERDCGATTAVSTHVSILRSTDEVPERPGAPWPAEVGNVFVAEKGALRPAGWRGGGPWVQVVWATSAATPHTLLVRYDASARLLKGEPEAFGSPVRYEALAGH